MGNCMEKVFTMIASHKTEGLLRPANRFVMEGKQTKHAEFSYPVTKFISDVEALSIGLYEMYKRHNGRTSNRCLCFFNMLKTSHHMKQTSPYIIGQGPDSQDKKPT